MYKTARTIAAEGITITNGFQNLGHICVLVGGVPILRRRSTGLFGRTQGAQDCFVSPQAGPLAAHNRERNHGNLHLACADQGIRKIKDSPKRADAFKEMAKKCGATVKDVFWTLGAYDVVAVVEAPDDISITALGLSTGALGNVRTQTLRAFTPADMKTILGKMVKS